MPAVKVESHLIGSRPDIFLSETNEQDKILKQQIINFIQNRATGGKKDGQIRMFEIRYSRIVQKDLIEKDFQNTKQRILKFLENTVDAFFLPYIKIADNFGIVEDESKITAYGSIMIFPWNDDFTKAVQELDTKKIEELIKKSHILGN